MKPCERCGKVKTAGMRYAKRAMCFTCIDEAIEIALEYIWEAKP